MASVTVLNATRMLAIEAASVVSGTVNGSGNLILTTQGGSTIVAGHVRGAEGPTGPTGPTGPQGAQGIQGLPGTPAPTITDSGWINLPYASGFTAGVAGQSEQIQYRVRAGVIYFRGGATGTFTAGTYHVVVPAGSIPVAYRPDVNVRGGAMGQAVRPCSFEINVDGSVKLGTNGLSSMPPWIAMSASYPV